jgi:hypothetical protein
LVTFEQLKSLSKCSDEELKQSLENIGAIEKDGFVRLIGSDIVEDVITTVVNLAMANGWAKLDQDGKPEYSVNYEQLMYSDPSNAEIDQSVLLYCLSNLMISSN